MASTSNHQQYLKKAKKYRKREDRISSLPESILVHILSFLPTRCTVRTSIFSKRWKQLWACVPNLNFFFKNIQKVHKNPFDFPDFIDCLLFFHELPRIQRFCLECDAVNLSRLSIWISVAIKRGVQELELDLNVGAANQLLLPPKLFTSKTLVVLKLSSKLQMKIIASVHFPNLRVLHMSLDYPSKGVAQKLFCSCPVLEDLFIGGNVLNRKKRAFKIVTPSLRKLEIDIIGYDRYEDSKNVFVVDAPILEHLTLQDDYFAQYRLMNLSSLVKADVNVGWCCMGAEGMKERANQVYGLLREITNVKFLALGDRTMGALDSADDNNLPLLFPNITHLELSVQNPCSKRVMYFAQMHA